MIENNKNRSGSTNQPGKSDTKNIKKNSGNVSPDKHLASDDEDLDMDTSRKDSSQLRSRESDKSDNKKGNR